MAGNIFINYRRDESGHVAGRLHDSLAPTFGRNKLFMDVDNIPVGRDFEDYLKSQVAACDAMLAVIGPNWLTAKDETGKRRLDNPDDFIVIEIGAALARNIPVVPVLVDGARMPKTSELPDSLKLLARRQAVEVRHTNFNRDAEALVKRLREALGYDSTAGRWRVQAIKALAAMAALFLVGWAGYEFIVYMQADKEFSQYTKTDIEKRFQEAQQQAERDQKAAVEAAVKAEQDRQAKAMAEAEAKRKAEETERQRQAEQERQTKAAAEAEEKHRRLEQAERQRKEGEAAANAGDYDKAIANFDEAIRLNPNDAVPYYDRGLSYLYKNDLDRSIADFNEALRLLPTYANAHVGRGLSYVRKGDIDRGITDYDESIRLDPTNAVAFMDRGIAKYMKGNNDQAISDLNEAIEYQILLSTQYTAASFCYRGRAKLKIKDTSGNADIAKSKELDASVCR